MIGDLLSTSFSCIKCEFKQILLIEGRMGSPSTKWCKWCFQRVLGRYFKARASVAWVLQRVRLWGSLPMEGDYIGCSEQCPL